jgi:hypothetical protein
MLCRCRRVDLIGKNVGEVVGAVTTGLVVSRGIY